MTRQLRFRTVGTITVVSGATCPRKSRRLEATDTIMPPVIFSMVLWLGVFFMVAFASQLAAQEVQSWDDNGMSKQMTQLNQKLTDAYLREDVKLLRTMLDDLHVHNNVFGVALTKNQFLKDIESGTLRFDEYKTPKIKWHIDGNTAIATGLIKAKAIRDGKVVPANSFLFTRVFVKRGDQWKVLLFHNTMARKKDVD